MDGLEVLLHKRGVAGTLALLKKHSRAALEDRLRTCLNAAAAEVQQASQDAGTNPGKGIPATTPAAELLKASKRVLTLLGQR